jgi:Tol biopolymer transport system component
MRYRLGILLTALSGGLIALAVILGRGLPDTRITYAACDPDAEIYVADWPRGLSFNISNSPGTQDEYPVWSPDGQQIAYRKGQGRTFAVYVYELLTGHTRSLTVDFDRAERPMWSPDGQHIAFVRTQGGQPVRRLRLWMSTRATSVR